jgi:hypothetical protein
VIVVLRQGPMLHSSCGSRDPLAALRLRRGYQRVLLVEAGDSSLTVMSEESDPAACNAIRGLSLLLLQLPGGRRAGDRCSVCQ